MSVAPRRLVPAIALSLAGAAVAYRQAARRREGGGQAPAAIAVPRSVIVDRPADELYRRWRDLEGLPRFVTRLRSVEAQDGGRSHWRADGPAAREITWEAEVVEERENELLRWRSVPPATVPHSVTVRFERAPGERGTQVGVELELEPPAGPLLAPLVGEWPARKLTEDLRRFKQLMETGEVATTEGQPSGRRAPLGRALSRGGERSPS